jgi:hypothetical protein
VSRDEEQQRYVYFHYERADIDTQRSAHEIELLQENLDAGFRARSVEAFTSPEGSLDPGRRFQGNRTLAEERARVAAELVRSLAPGGSGAVGDGTVVESGAGELYGGGETELTGRALEEAAVEQFRSQDAEARHRSDELLEQLERAGSSRRRAQLVYPWLRRAVITLHRTVTEQEPYTVRVPAGTERERRAAPPAVLRAAKQHFALHDGLRRP